MVCVLGGMGTDCRPFRDVWRSADSGKTWKCVTSHAPWPARRGHCTAVLPRGALLVLGGIGATDAGSSAVLGDAWHSSDCGSTWVQIPRNSCPPRFDSCSAVLPGGIVLVFGGQDTIAGDLCNDVWRGTVTCMTPSSKNWQWQADAECGRADEVRATALPNLLMEKQRPRCQGGAELAPYRADKGNSLVRSAPLVKWQGKSQRSQELRLQLRSGIAAEGPLSLEGVSPTSQPEAVHLLDVLDGELCPPLPPPIVSPTDPSAACHVTPSNSKEVPQCTSGRAGVPGVLQCCHENLLVNRTVAC